MQQQYLHAIDTQNTLQPTLDLSLNASSLGWIAFDQGNLNRGYPTYNGRNMFVVKNWQFNATTMKSLQLKRSAKNFYPLGQTSKIVGSTAQNYTPIQETGYAYIVHYFGKQTGFEQLPYQGNFRYLFCLTKVEQGHRQNSWL